jgi:hypothetical protein
MIMAACQRSLTMVAGGMSRGFTCDTRRKPITLKRFELPASATDLASEEPEFMEDV